jgi:hypothetical protein
MIRSYMMVQYNIFNRQLAEALKITPGKRSPTISPLQGEDGTFVLFLFCLFISTYSIYNHELYCIVLYCIVLYCIVLLHKYILFEVATLTCYKYATIIH